MSSAQSSAPRDAVQLCRLLHRLFPEFGRFLGGAYFMMDYRFTPHAVCSTFTDFYLREPIDYAAAQTSELFATIELIAAADPYDADPVANALFTCFLENISSTAAGEASRPLMGEQSLSFFIGWHKWPPN
jgi:hypothetical protein